jgi:hypothetical protein
VAALAVASVASVAVVVLMMALVISKVHLFSVSTEVLDAQEF